LRQQFFFVTGGTKIMAAKKLAKDAKMTSRGATEKGGKGRKDPSGKMPNGKKGREY
jgi:hypothetical protein